MICAPEKSESAQSEEPIALCAQTIKDQSGVTGVSSHCKNLDIHRETSFLFFVFFVFQTLRFGEACFSSLIFVFPLLGFPPSSLYHISIRLSRAYQAFFASALIFCIFAQEKRVVFCAEQPKKKG